MGSGQVNFRCHILLIRFQPARRAQAPAIAWIKTGETKVWHWRGKVIAAKPGVLQEFVAYLYANRMRAPILVAGVTTAIAIKTGNRVATARQQLLVEYVY